MSDLGQVFPPRDEWDVAAYDSDECMAGYCDHSIHDPAPGENRSPAFRWGWTNARKDSSRIADGFEGIRGAAIAIMKRPQ